MRECNRARRVRVLLVQPRPIVLAGLLASLREHPDVAVVAEASTGQEALCWAESLAPDVALLDTKLPDICGLDAIRLLHARCPQARVVAFADADEPLGIRTVLASGVAGYLLESATPDDVARAVRAAGRGQRFLQGEVVERLASLADRPALAECLSPRELEVLAHVALGESNEEIARCLDLAVKTVEMHVGNVLAKLCVRSRTQAALLALKSGLVAAPGSSEPTEAGGYLPQTAPRRVTLIGAGRGGVRLPVAAGRSSQVEVASRHSGAPPSHPARCERFGSRVCCPVEEGHPCLPGDHARAWRAYRSR